MASNETAAQGSLRPARRTIVKGAAWAVPAVAIASAAPAFAASDDCLEVTLTSDACKCPGAGNDWSYFLGFCFTNNCTTGTTPVTITITNLTNNSGKLFDPAVTSPVEFSVMPGEEFCTTTSYHTSESSASKIRVFYNLDGVPQGYAEVDAPPNCADGLCPDSLLSQEPAAKTTVEEPAVEEPAGEEPAPGADTESSTASPQG